MDIGKKSNEPETHNAVDNVAIPLFVEIVLSFILRRVEIKPDSEQTGYSEFFRILFWHT